MTPSACVRQFPPDFKTHRADGNSNLGRFHDLVGLHMLALTSAATDMVSALACTSSAEWAQRGTTVPSNELLSTCTRMFICQIPRSVEPVAPLSPERLWAQARVLPRGEKFAFEFRHPSWYHGPGFQQVRRRKCQFEVLVSSDQ